jgi:hypothetical protein
MARRKKGIKAQLTDQADDLVRVYFKLFYGDNPQCFVCDRYDWWWNSKTHPNGIQVGHYITRQVGLLRWDLLNLFPQCSGCNRTHNVNPAPFTPAIIKRHGVERIQYLNTKTLENKGTRITVGFRRQAIFNLEAEIEKLKQEANESEEQVEEVD